MTPALWFLRHDVAIFPIKTRGKEPACVSWDDFQATPEQAAIWGTGPTTLNYGVCLGRLSVVDTDNPEDEYWVQQYCIDTPFKVVTARGLHRYYRQTKPQPKYIHRDGLTIEHRNYGQYVVGPGSTHPSGLVYAAIDWSWNYDEIPTFPESFDFDDRPMHLRPSGPGMPYIIPTEVRAGERHDEMFRLVRSLRARGVPTQAAMDACYLVNLEKCKPPLPREELYRYLRRVEHHSDRAQFIRPPGQSEWELAAGLLDIGLEPGVVAEIVKSVTPGFDPKGGTA